MLQSALNSVRRVKNRLVAEHGPDAPLVPQMELWRAGQPVVLLSLEPNRDAILQVMPFAISAFRATQVVLTFDGWQELQPVNPDTGKEWEQDEKQAYVEAHGRDNGVVAETLTAAMWDDTGAVAVGWAKYSPTTSPLGIHRVTWNDERIVVVGNDLVYTDDLFTDVAAHGFQILADTQEDIGDLAETHQRMLLGGESELNAILDAAAIRELETMPVVTALILCDRDDELRRVALERILHRRMAETPEGAFEVDVKARAARWN